MSEREVRPPEQTLAEWVASMTPGVHYMKSVFSTQIGHELTDLEVYQYIAWASALSVNRILWIVDEETAGYFKAVVGATATDLMGRYKASFTGVLAPPKPTSPRFETPEAFEAYCDKMEKQGPGAKPDTPMSHTATHVSSEGKKFDGYL